jgi:hypothetical protein
MADLRGMDPLCECVILFGGGFGGVKFGVGLW